jgi:hypothetical protein
MLIIMSQGIEGRVLLTAADCDDKQLVSEENALNYSVSQRDAVARLLIHAFQEVNEVSTVEEEVAVCPGLIEAQTQLLPV